ncbi:MAG: ATP-binding protein [Candidatus Thermoplasmatota archaeon]|nr:ATP-binding protein [Candidatus Thermoplasmatota archaeon]
MQGVIIEELIKKGVTVVIIDPHGEYGTLGRNSPENRASFDYASAVREFAFDTDINPGAVRMLLTCSNFTPQELLSATSLRESRQHLSLLSSAIEQARKEGAYDLKSVIAHIEEDSQYSGQLISELKTIDGSGIFAAEGTRMSELIVKGKTTVLNLKGLTPELQGLFTKRILTAVFELRKRNKVPPLLTVLEEAHNFCPQQGRTDASRIIRTVASEGRKFGMGLMVITQRAAKVDKNVLSQCNTQFILKVTNPIDLKVIYNSIEGLTEETLEEIPRLRTGVCIGIGGGLSVPVFIQVRRRETVHGGDSIRLVGR